MKEIFEKNEVEEYPKLDKNICPECKQEMNEFKDKFKCFKCGIGVDK